MTLEQVETAAPPQRTGVIVAANGPAGLAVAGRTARVMPVTLVVPIGYETEPDEELAGVRFFHGDPTSMLVLREAGILRVQALLAATLDDAVNVETARLAVAAGVPDVICRLANAELREEVMAMGAHPVTADMAMAGTLTSLLPGVVVTTSEVGLGEGEILQVRVMPGSLVISRPLHEIATRAFLVAAIYRDGELVVPHGDTRVEAGDQVLLVGRPDTLRAIADYFRLGAAQFPRQFGHSIVLWNPEDDPRVAADAAHLTEASRCRCVFQVVRTPTDRERDLPLERLLADPLNPMTQVSPGLFILPPPKRGLFGRFGKLGPMGELLDRARSPLLLARGSTPYKRILVPVADSSTSWRGLELAVDIARTTGARITALHAAQPRFLAGSAGAERTRAVEANVQQIAQLYKLQFEVVVEEGNPIQSAVRLAGEHQLVVAARNLRQPDTYFRPDIGLRIALAAPCSAVLLTVT